MTEARYSRGRVRGERLGVPWDGRLVATYPALKREGAIRPIRDEKSASSQHHQGYLGSDVFKVLGRNA
jgi:hypothetical protein